MLESLPSLYPDTTSAARDSLPANKQDVRKTLQVRGHTAVVKPMTQGIAAILLGDEYFRDDTVFAPTIFCRNRFEPDIGPYALPLRTVVLDCSGAM